MFDQFVSGPPPLRTDVKVALTIWCVVLVPWIPFFTLMGTGMAFEGGYTLAAWLFVFVVWAYPVFVGVAWFFRRRRPALVWLPALILVPVGIELMRSH